MQKKLTIILAFILLFLIYCCYLQWNRNVDVKLFDQIYNFEKNEDFFSDYSFSKLREGKYGSFQVSRFDSTGNYAVIRLYPKSKIEKNFFIDTIDIYFVEKFKSLNCEYFSQNRSFTRMDVIIFNNKYMIYKMTSDLTYTIRFDTTNSKRLSNWSYIKVKDIR